MSTTLLILFWGSVGLIAFAYAGYPLVVWLASRGGRDAADVPLINSFGPHELKAFRVWTYDVTGLPLATSPP